MEEKSMDNDLGKLLSLILALMVFFLVYSYWADERAIDCEDKGGALVRTFWWFSCMQTAS
jgi:hypothetical protein